MNVALLCSGIHKLLASNLHVHVYTSVHFNVCKIHTYMYIHTERERLSISYCSSVSEHQQVSIFWSGLMLLKLKETCREIHDQYWSDM